MMNKIIPIGKWLFIIPFAMFGFLHFRPLEFSIGHVPEFLPFKAFWVYFSGAAFSAFVIAAVTKKYDKLAAVLLALELILFVILIHVPMAIAGDFLGIISIFKDTAMAGAALIYANHLAQDNRVIK